MRKVKLSARQSKLGTILILFTVIFTSSVTYANVVSPRTPVEYAANIGYQIIAFAIIILILGLISLLLMKVIKKIIIEVNEIKNEFQVRNIIHRTAIEKSESQRKSTEDEGNDM